MQRLAKQFRVDKLHEVSVKIMCNVIAYGPAITQGKRYCSVKTSTSQQLNDFLLLNKPSIHFPKRSSCPVSRINEPFKAQYKPDKSSQNLDPLLIVFQHFGKYLKLSPHYSWSVTVLFTSSLFIQHHHEVNCFIDHIPVKPIAFPSASAALCVKCYCTTENTAKHYRCVLACWL